MKRLIPVIFLVLIAGKNNIRAQLTGFNLLEYQFGNIPGQNPSDVHSGFDQFNLDYRWKSLKTSIRLENFYSTDTNRIHYTKLTQYSLAYRKKGLELKAGNFYETLGKGLLFRGYEIKNSVYEDQIYRVKQGFYRDTRGVFGSYSHSVFQIKALHGKSLINQLPANDPNNRLDLVSAAEASVSLFNQNIGAIWLQNKNNVEPTKYLSTFIGGNFWGNFDYYGELAHQINKGNRFLGFENDNSYGGYFTLGYSAPGFGVSFEMKDYHNLFIGSGISDPPTLVKEHIYKLLNRSTHVPFYFDESGMQLELFIVPAQNHIITLNHSRSKNELGETDFKSAEYFADWQFSFKNHNQMKVFADYSFDEILFETARYTAGLYYTRILQNHWSVSAESEYQHLERTFSQTNAYRNIYLGLIANYTTKFSAALVWEFTNDPKVADLAGTTKTETTQHYPGVSFLYKPNSKNTVQLFAGKRRGGPACTSGICYEVLDFKGLELRWAKKF